MVTIKINGMPATVADQSRLIDAIRAQGIEVPSLCYKPGMEHYTSCMVCMVRDNDTGRFIPSCSAMVRDGMDIDASGPAVTEMRAEAVRLLLVEHRAECEAPCKLVCPKKLDIPLMNRLLTDGKVAEATALAFETLGDPVAVCTACKGYCDKACRRKKIDTNISIKNTIIYLASAHKEWAAGGRRPATGTHPETETPQTPNPTPHTAHRTPQPATSNQQPEPLTPHTAYPTPHTPHPTPHTAFNSTLGSVTDEEFREWLKEARDGATNHPNPTTDAEASEEASRCLHCDCRAAHSCDLRSIAGSLAVKNPRGKYTAHSVNKKINPVSGLIFEHAKCIKCGLCVRLGATLTNQPSLCFKGRGFETIISEPLYHNFVDIINEAAPQFSDICPTGALELKKGYK
jgi:predicted molibdopterin-dependent oxidoreductase YjgC